MSSVKPETRCLLQSRDLKPPELVMGSIRNADTADRSSNELYYTSSSNDEDEDDDDLEADDSDCHLTKSSSNITTQEKIAVKKKPHLKHTHRQRHQIHRGARRLVRTLMCILLMPVILIMLYLPLYSSIQNRRVALPDWSQNTSRNIAEYILPDNDTSLLEPRHVCQARDKFFLLIVVCSDLHNFAVRQTIRETWGNTTEFNYGMFLHLHAHLKRQYLEPSEQRLAFYSEYIGINKNQTMDSVTTIPLRVVFFVGRSKPTSVDNDLVANRIRNESERYQDIVQEDFIDTYNNLTLKSVLVLKWVTRRCLENCAYVMKCDDDTFVNVPNLLHYLLGGTIPLYNDALYLYNAHTYKVLSWSNRLSKTRDYLAGYLFCTARPISNLSSKWYMPYYMYPDEKYPKYLSGAGYIMSIDVVPQLFEMTLNTSLIYLEDIYITGMCAEKLKLKRIHQPLFGYVRKKELCSLRGSISQHEMKGDRLSEAYAFVTNLTNQCALPEKFFKHIPLRRSTDCG